MLIISIVTNFASMTKQVEYFIGADGKEYSLKTGAGQMLCNTHLPSPTSYVLHGLHPITTIGLFKYNNKGLSTEYIMTQSFLYVRKFYLDTFYSSTIKLTPPFALFPVTKNL